MKQLFIITFCLLALASCNHKPDTTDSLAVRMDLYDEEAFIHPADFRFTEYTDKEWAQVYTAYIHDSLKDLSIHKYYTLCYIDEDDVPELCLRGRNFGEWSLMLTQHEGKVRTQYYGINPEYIEHTGLIKSCIYNLDRTLRTYIYKIEEDAFMEILETEAECVHNSENPFEQWDYFVYSINGKVVDTLYGMEYDEWSCPQLNEAYRQAYELKGTSREVF